MFLKDHLAGSDADDPISFIIHSKRAHLFWGWAFQIIHQQRAGGLLFWGGEPLALHPLGSLGPGL